MFRLEPKTKLVLASLSVVLAVAMSGCASNVDRAVATSPVPDDFHLRHPVALANARRTLDVFPGGYAKDLDYRQKREVEAFARDYLASGNGSMLAQIPRSGDRRSIEAAWDAIRRTLTAQGMRGDIAVADYAANDASVASVIRLSFVQLQTKAVSRCGEWPDDLASGGNVSGWDNRSYYNFGCATQKTLAAQLDDPRDLVRPRVEEPRDVYMATRPIKSIRAGSDPSTIWLTSQPRFSPISPVGSN